MVLQGNGTDRIDEEVCLSTLADGFPYGLMQEVCLEIVEKAEEI